MTYLDGSIFVLFPLRKVNKLRTKDGDACKIELISDDVDPA
jgi:hypothetical protein